MLIKIWHGQTIRVKQCYHLNLTHRPIFLKTAAKVQIIPHIRINESEKSTRFNAIPARADLLKDCNNGGWLIHRPLLFCIFAHMNGKGDVSLADSVMYHQEVG